MAQAQKVTDPADPNRCQSNTGGGDQCWYESLPESKYCHRHDNGRDLAEQKHTRGYLLAQAADRTRLATVSDHLEPVKALRESIALLTIMIEKRWNLVRNDGDLLQACGPLNTMLQNMERLVTSCHKIEQNLGLLLARQAIMSLARQMVEVIIDELEGIDDYEAIVDRITARLIDLIGGAANQTPGTPGTTITVLPSSPST